MALHRNNAVIEKFIRFTRSLLDVIIGLFQLFLIRVCNIGRFNVLV